MRTVGVSRPTQRTEAPDPRLDPTLLEQYHEGLILLTGCRQGEISQLLEDGQITAAREVLGRYISWLGAENIFVELQHNLVFGDTRRVGQLSALASHAGVRTVATGNVHYH